MLGAYDQVAHPPSVSQFWVDLTVVARCADPVLAPLRNWAGGGGPANHSSRNTNVHLGSTALCSLAVLCGIEPSELTTRLTRATTPHRPGQHRLSRKAKGSTEQAQRWGQGLWILGRAARFGSGEGTGEVGEGVQVVGADHGIAVGPGRGHSAG